MSCRHPWPSSPLFLFLLLSAGCASPDLGVSPFFCNKGDPRCPEGYVCLANKCVREGEPPPADAGSRREGLSADDLGTDDLSTSGPDRAVPPADGPRPPLDQKIVQPDQPQVPTATHLVINEIDYDQIGGDTAEFVEIYNGSSSDASLSGIALVLLNGSTNAEYLRVDLGPAKILKAGQFLVVAPATLPIAGSALKVPFSGTQDQVQNGSPDGVAIINTVSKTVLDAFCYEGPMGAVQITGFASKVSLVEGTVLDAQIADSNTDQGALCRLPSGQDTNNAAADWKFCKTPTPGAANLP